RPSVTYRTVALNATVTTASYTLSLHDALPIYRADALAHPAPHAASLAAVRRRREHGRRAPARAHREGARGGRAVREAHRRPRSRSEEHTSELQSRENLVCRLLLEKKKTGTTWP